jgi:hypothetical protein
MADLIAHSEVGDIQGQAFFKFRTSIYKLDFLKESVIENGEPLKFWQITLEGSNNMSVHVTPSFLPWGVEGRLEIRVPSHELEPGHVYDSMMAQVSMLISALLDLLRNWILAEQNVPYWLVEVFNILEYLSDNVEEVSLPVTWFSEE